MVYKVKTEGRHGTELHEALTMYVIWCDFLITNVINQSDKREENEKRREEEREHSVRDCCKAKKTSQGSQEYIYRDKRHSLFSNSSLEVNYLFVVNGLTGR